MGYATRFTPLAGIYDDDVWTHQQAMQYRLAERRIGVHLAESKEGRVSLSSKRCIQAGFGY